MCTCTRAHVCVAVQAMRRSGAAEASAVGPSARTRMHRAHPPCTHTTTTCARSPPRARPTHHAPAPRLHASDQVGAVGMRDLGAQTPAAPSSVRTCTMHRPCTHITRGPCICATHAPAPCTHSRCASPPSSPPRCSAAVATVPGAEVAAAKLTAAAAAEAEAEAARRVRRRPSPFRLAARRTPCSSPATRRHVAARYRSSYRPRYGPCARCRRAGFQSRLRSRTARSRRANCRSFTIVRRFRPLQTLTLPRLQPGRRPRACGRDAARRRRQL